MRNVNEYVDLLAERVEELESQEGGSVDDAEWDAAQDAFWNAILHAPNAESEYVAQFLLDVHPSLEKGDRGAVAKALYDELRLLESQFAEYLRVDVERAEDYEKRSRRLLTDIYGYGFEQSCFSPKAECPLTVLSFNYTSPGLPKRKGRKFDVDFVNVHGRLVGEVIFGADGLDCLDDADVARFSKTYRVAQRGAVSASRLDCISFHGGKCWRRLDDGHQVFRATRWRVRITLTFRRFSTWSISTQVASGSIFCIRHMAKTTIRSCSIAWQGC